MIELHLIVRTESALEALGELAEIGRRAAQELGAGPHPADTAVAAAQTDPPAPAGNGNGADHDEGAPEEIQTAPKIRRRIKRPLTREQIIVGLTDLYMAGDLDLRARITAFRDQFGAQRLKDLSDEALPGALALLTELGAP